MMRWRVLSTFLMALESQYCGALDTLVRVIGAGHKCVGVLMFTWEIVQCFYVFLGVCATPALAPRFNV